MIVVILFLYLCTAKLLNMILKSAGNIVILDIFNFRVVNITPPPVSDVIDNQLYAYFYIRT